MKKKRGNETHRSSIRFLDQSSSIEDRFYLGLSLSRSSIFDLPRAFVIFDLRLLRSSTYLELSLPLPVGSASFDILTSAPSSLSLSSKIPTSSAINGASSFGVASLDLEIRNSLASVCSHLNRAAKGTKNGESVEPLWLSQSSLQWTKQDHWPSEFLHKYRDFKRLLQQVQNGRASDAARQVAESLIQVKLLNWRHRPLLNASETNLLLNKLQELSLVKLCPDFCDACLPPQAIGSIRLALATNLTRAILRWYLEEI